MYKKKWSVSKIQRTKKGKTLPGSSKYKAPKLMGSRSWANKFRNVSISSTYGVVSLANTFSTFSLLNLTPEPGHSAALLRPWLARWLVVHMGSTSLFWPYHSNVCDSGSLKLKVLLSARSYMWLSVMPCDSSYMPVTRVQKNFEKNFKILYNMCVF